MAPVVEKSRMLGEGIGVNATPAFFVNGRPLSGMQPFERFKELVDHELANPGR
jgi:protein-disulfide isomerase